MDINPLLDITIGLLLMYLLLSLFCTVINEFVASIMKLRAGNLREGIEKLIDDPKLHEALESTGFMRSIKRVSGKRGPSYLSPRTFALALIEAIKSDKDITKTGTYEDVLESIQKLPESDVRNVLMSLAKEATGDLEKLRDDIGTWFDNIMDRVAGVYKRKLQVISVCIALALAVAVGADSIAVARALWSDATLRQQIVQAATEIVDQTQSIDDLAQLKDIEASLRPFPIGWDFESPPFATDWFKNFWGWVIKVCGLLLTALAISIGAPFWFDLLQKFMKLRGSGGVPHREEEAGAGAKK